MIKDGLIFDEEGYVYCYEDIKQLQITANECKQKIKEQEQLIKFLKADNNNLYKDLQFIKDTGYETPQRLALEFISLRERNNKAIEILKLCNSKCAKETIEILKGDSNE